jgi:hypothetical protein
VDPLAPPTTPPAEPAPEPDDRVGFCRDAPEPDWPEAKATPAQGQWDQQIWYAGFCTAILLIGWALNNIPKPNPWLLAALAGLVVVMLVVLVVFLRRRRKPLDGEIEDPPILRRSAARVRCAGDVPLMLAIRARGPFDPELAFEPVIRATTFAVPQRKALRWTFEVLRVVLALALIFGAPMLFSVRSAGCVFPMLCFAVGTLIAGALVLLLAPTYVRITPGKLEIMRFGFAQRTPEIETFDLSRATIWAWVGKKAFIETGSPDAKRLVIHLNAIRSREEFTHALLWAGVSKVRAPELPRDDLLG